MKAGRAAGAILLTATWLALGAGPAAADPAGPTDFLSKVTEVDPEVAGIDLEIIGGDSFVLLSVSPGVHVDVVGYTGEPYLRVLADGTVEENQLSPSKYLNEDRYAASEIPAEADGEAAPKWEVVAGDGSFAWHDHRTHWMSDINPPGKGPGDQVAEGVIPLFVDGVEVDVTVASVWQDPPSSLPMVMGITVGIALAVAGIRRGGGITSAAILGCALGAGVVGMIAFLSVPTETAPSLALWGLPAMALALGLIAVLRRSLNERTRNVVLLVAALELVVWGISHWGWLWPAVLPTNAPFWLDRFVGAAVLTGAIGATVAVVLAAATDRSVSFRP